MTLSELISLARTLLRDKQEPYFWSDAELTEFVNEAVDEACLRARLLASQVLTPVVAGIDHYTIPYNVLRLVQAEFINRDTVATTAGAFTPGQWYTIAVPGTTDFTLIGAVDSLAGTAFLAEGAGSGTGTAYLGSPTTLVPLSQRQFLAAKSCDTSQAVRPTHITFYDSANDIRILPVPEEAGSLILSIHRLPTSAERLDDLSDTPAIPEIFHHDLVYWVLAAAYSVDVADTKNAAASEKYEAMFEARFGRRATARGETQGRRSVVGSNVYPYPFGG